jgi:asparagine synthase (glutamine-hydrolysing)
MCGFIGYFGKKKLDKSKFKNISNQLNHRGPDSEGFFFQEDKKVNVYFGFKRLSILDLSKNSNQPMKFRNKIILFNGEIYNYIEIRKKLIKLGYKFFSNGDTEVVLKAIYEWGSNAYKLFKGMWAIVIYDKATNHISFSRDRFGEKPLYYFLCDDGIFFASEIKTLRELIPIKTKINEYYLIKFLQNGYKSLFNDESTFYKKIFCIKKSSIFDLSIYKNKVKFNNKKYWKIETKEKITDYSNLVKKLKRKILQSIELTLRSDVPMAFCMSGGVDSNTIISIAKKVFNYDVKGFTIKNQNSDYDEAIQVKKSVKFLGIDHQFVEAKKDDFLTNLEEQIKHRAMPVFTISYYLHNLLLRKISRDGYKVSLSGTGGDEIYSGYHDFHLLFLKNLKKDNEKKFSQFLSEWKKEQLPYLRNPLLRNYKEFLIKPPVYDFNFPFESEYLNKDIIKKIKLSFIKYSKNSLKDRMLNSLFHESVPVILHEDDLNSMQYSVENRSPILNHEILEILMSCNYKNFYKRNISKNILRDSVSEFVEPSIVSNTTKVGFNSSLTDICNLNSAAFKSFILEETEVDKYFNKDKILLSLKNININNHHTKILFNYINCKIFLKNFG